METPFRRFGKLRQQRDTLDTDAGRGPATVLTAANSFTSGRTVITDRYRVKQ